MPKLTHLLHIAHNVWHPFKVWPRSCEQCRQWIRRKGA